MCSDLLCSVDRLVTSEAKVAQDDQCQPRVRDVLVKFQTSDIWAFLQKDAYTSRCELCTYLQGKKAVELYNTTAHSRIQIGTRTDIPTHTSKRKFCKSVLRSLPLRTLLFTNLDPPPFCTSFLTCPSCLMMNSTSRPSTRHVSLRSVYQTSIQADSSPNRRVQELLSLTPCSALLFEKMVMLL